MPKLPELETINRKVSRYDLYVWFPKWRRWSAWKSFDNLYEAKIHADGLTSHTTRIRHTTVETVTVRMIDPKDVELTPQASAVLKK